jgi:glycosyltransferase involved in cell wall biosynthesis
MPLKLSVAYITRDEEKRLPQSLEAIKSIADEIVVVDSGSTDNTIPMAKAYGCIVISRNWTGYGNQKNAALDACSGDIILSLDADELPDRDLIASIAGIKEMPLESLADGYNIKRKSFFLGKKLEYSWQPDVHLRLVKKGAKASWSDSAVHEKLILESHSINELKGFLNHYTYSSISHQMAKMNDYALLSAKQMYKNGKKPIGRGALVFRTIWRFKKHYFLKRGFLDGYPGLIASMGETVYSYLKYAYLYELHQKSDRQKVNQVQTF